MHAALQIEEVFIRITDTLDQSTTDSRSTLYALARTCRTFHEPAINILWHTQTSLGPILSCIPSVKIYTSVPDRMVPFSRRKLGIKVPEDHRVDDDWQTFYKYSCKIKRFRWDVLGHPKASYTIDHDVFEALLQTPTRPLFPRLRILQWPIPGVRFGDQEFIFLFFGPHINEIDLRAVSLDPYKKTINLMKECCPALSSFSFTCEPFPELRDLFRGWESLRTLKCAGFPHHGKMWTLPILLPNLETLHLGITGLGAAQTKPAGTSMMKYASLRNLTLATMYQSIEHINDLLSMLSFPRPESLSISICTVIYPTHISVESLFDSDTVARICSFDALQKVEVTLGGDYYNACSIHSLTLQPLLSFFKMQTLNITAFCFMDLDDEFLEDISHAWKSIVSLCLQPDSRLWLMQSQITLRGLEHLSQRCPRLEQFAAVISAYIPPVLPASYLASTTNNGKEPCNLVSLSLTNSTITSPYDVAVFLCSQFPRLVCISSEWKRNDDPESIANREQWARVQELVRELWRKDQ